MSRRGEDALVIMDTGKLVSDASHAVIAKVVAGKAPVGVALAGDRVVTANSNRFAGPGRKGEWLSVIDPVAARVVGNVPVGLFPRELYVTGKTLLVTNFSSSSLLVDLGRLTPAYFAQQKSLKDADVAQQAAAEAALKACIASGKPSPGTEAALRKVIAALTAKTPDYDDMVPGLANAVRANADAMGTQIAGWGPLQSVALKTITPQGVDIFAVKSPRRHGMVHRPDAGGKGWDAVPPLSLSIRKRKTFAKGLALSIS